MEVVRQILQGVKDGGDEAIKKYSQMFDGIDIDKFEMTKKQIEYAYSRVDKKTIEALKHAAKNIKIFAKKQLECFKDFEIEVDGATIGQRIIPIEKVGCYVPGGNYPLPSTALMCVIPAKVAGVKEVIVCSPKMRSVTVVAADIAGADRIFNVGGVQAIGAMAYGTETVPAVNKIVGPGSKYVVAAKNEVYGEVGLDFIAGPSEVLIIADESGKADFIAADLLAQAEHDSNAKPFLLTTSKKLAEKVVKQIEKHLVTLETREIIEQSLQNGKIIIVKDLEEAIEISNKRAPEHLELQIKKPDAIIKKLINYGSLFVGKYAAEAFGDYCSGTNHTLPTNGSAKYTSGLSVRDFIKMQTHQKIKNPSKLIDTAAEIANVEGLMAHKLAAEIRREK
ncbi:MAG: histidinol dehydrogenase [Candidatus Diapherotrites archaeon]|uniref:Histidinol dehydrogenase n=1 Tax=Candidatus Iainarchaeum sp. TaxID=3101447 RepID=A0A8T5GEF3_9ARCH|nr:histidinol dehydrogenase [Candidatus Diapherotrites archaeon]MBT7240936.1 histidinol dehydrogenase [Candidatus Diapherotrites archaeon]